MTKHRHKITKDSRAKRVFHHARRAGVKLHRHLKPHAQRAKSWWQARKLHQKIIIWLMIVVLLIIGSTYGIARWYIAEHASEPLEFGVTFIPSYARYFELDPQETMQAMINDLGIRNFRLVSYWEAGEPTKGTYNFTDLDWEFKQAEAAHAKVSLSVGLRQPRWPECHQPDWVTGEPENVWYSQLKAYMRAVINRYKNSPSLDSYQLENEYFLRVFGTCTNFSRDRLIDEYSLVKQLDPHHSVIVARSNNAIGFPIGKPTPDEFGVSVYKRVWDKNVTHRYIEYPFPAWFYAFLAGGGELLTGKNMVIHELQAEAWLPDGYDIKTAPKSELDKSMTPERLHNRLEYGRATGMRSIDLWGVEWWYYRKVKFNDPGLWDTAKTDIKRLTATNKQCTDYYAHPDVTTYAKAAC